ncbi:MAG TPA: hypothetical protein VMX33_03805 [bacterium]|nr:hypothetical protein [bacterium]
MNVSDLSGQFGFEALVRPPVDHVIVDAYTSDLLSDVMARASEGSALVTIQAHKNTVAVASLVGSCAIVLCNDRAAPADMIEAAGSEGIAIFRTPMNQFEVSGVLYRALRG